ncbi:MAG: A/G-specific adenine glycosylase [Thermoclostridium sp.]|nr:A/G-specific adenine glycosylase [Thermoclostridium sp.]
MRALSEKLLNWYNSNKRDLPWRHTSDPYAILVSEIMLQQTRVDTVISYYHQFLERFPTAASLALAQEDEVLNLWKGLGYYSRARNLHKAAKLILHEHQGKFPSNFEQVRKLPGVGDYTAGAVMSIAFNLPFPAVDGNVSRVITRINGIDSDIALPETKSLITDIVKQMIPSEHSGDFTQTLMELGATVCFPTTPLCDKCPVLSDCRANKEQKTELLPVKQKKQKPQIQSFYALLLLDGQKLLMTRSHLGTLLKNLWGVPLIERESIGETPAEKLQRQILDKTGIEVLSFQAMGKVKHVFTHRIWEMEILSCSECSIHELKQEYQWISLEAIEELPIPTAFTKLLRAGGLG